MKGATADGIGTTFAGDSFNPRAREGRDPTRPRVNRRDTGVSIHAPVKGATSVAKFNESWGDMFQSTRP